MSGRPVSATEREAASALRLLGRALRLRCPHCGGAPVFASWFRRRERCGACGLRFARTGADYFTGAMFFNLILAEALFAGGLLITLVARWPAVPWDILTAVAVAGMIAAPVLFHPFSQVLFLALDTFFRPVTAAERTGMSPAEPATRR